MRVHFQICKFFLTKALTNLFYLLYKSLVWEISWFVVKEIDHKVFYIVFEAVGGCGLGVSLWAHVVGVAALSEGLTGLRVLEENCIVEWSFRIVHKENPSMRWRLGHIASGSTSKQFSFVCDCSSSLSQSNSL